LTVISRTGYGSKFRACATAIERAFPEIEVLGNAKGKPRSGAFEVSSEDGVVFWSKLGTISSVAFSFVSD
jgi:selT/selW/selH-like putative selenoprotein